MVDDACLLVCSWWLVTIDGCCFLCGYVAIVVCVCVSVISVVIVANNKISINQQ